MAFPKCAESRRRGEDRKRLIAGFQRPGNDEPCCCLLARDLNRETRGRIIEAYLRSLEGLRESIGIDSELPYPKELIALAIYQELVECDDADSRGRLEIAYVQLESFVPYSDYKIVSDFKSASVQATLMVDCGDPMSLVRSAEVLKKAKGDRAVRIQEQVSENMRDRLRQVRQIASARLMGKLMGSFRDFGKRRQCP